MLKTISAEEIIQEFKDMAIKGNIIDFILYNQYMYVKAGILEEQRQLRDRPECKILEFKK